MKRKPASNDAVSAAESGRRCGSLCRSAKRNRNDPQPPSPAHSLQEYVEQSDATTSLLDSVQYWLKAASQSPVDVKAVPPQQIPTFSSDTTSVRNAPSATSRSRSSSPSKLSSQNYRAQVLSRLNIRIDAHVPEAIKAKLLPPLPALHQSQNATMRIADDLQCGARELVQRSTANEAEWQTLLEVAIKGLFRELNLKLCCLPNRGLFQYH